MIEDNQTPPRYPYERKSDLVTPTEREFFKTLRAAINKDHYYIVPQVHLSSLFNSKLKDKNERYGAFQHINRKSVDYVICTLKDLNPVCAVELDDDSHLKASRQKRDQIVNGIFKQTGLPLLRIPVSECKDVESLRSKLHGIPIPPSLSF